MADIIKAWPSQMAARKVAAIFSPEGRWNRYYFSVGRGKPRQPVERIWFTWRGRILGHFEVESIVCNDGTLPTLRSLEDEQSEWQFRKDVWIAVCHPGCRRLRERVFFNPFRGFRYFDLDSYRGSPDARHRFY